jgi:hypothetical protein
VTKKQKTGQDIEKQLFGVYLDLWYAEGDIEDRVEQLAEDLKSARKMRSKIKRSLAKVFERYKEIHGREPLKPKR